MSFSVQGVATASPYMKALAVVPAVALAAETVGAVADIGAAVVQETKQAVHAIGGAVGSVIDCWA